jgi:hypothetical protein
MNKPSYLIWILHVKLILELSMTLLISKTSNNLELKAGSFHVFLFLFCFVLLPMTTELSMTQIPGELSWF